MGKAQYKSIRDTENGLAKKQRRPVDEIVWKKSTDKAMAHQTNGAVPEAVAASKGEEEPLAPSTQKCNCVSYGTFSK